MSPGVVAGLIGARLRHAGGRWRIVAVGLAAGAAIPVLIAGSAAVTADAALQRGVEALPPGERSVVVSYNGTLEGGEAADADREVRAQLRRLAEGPGRRQLILPRHGRPHRPHVHVRRHGRARLRRPPHRRPAAAVVHAHPLRGRRRPTARRRPRPDAPAARPGRRRPRPAHRPAPAQRHLRGGGGQPAPAGGRRGRRGVRGRAVGVPALVRLGRPARPRRRAPARRPRLDRGGSPPSRTTWTASARASS